MHNRNCGGVVMGWRDMYSSSFSYSETYDLGNSKIDLTDSSSTPAQVPTPPTDTSRGENERNHTNISAPQNTR